MVKCDYCELRIRDADVRVCANSSDFHERCWQYMERQKRIAHRKAVGSTFALISGRSAGEDDNEESEC